MNKKAFWLSIIAVIISFAGGFFIANALNRKELDELRTEVGRLKSVPSPASENSADQTLSDEEIRQKLAEADKNPENVEFQKSLAMALYRYAGMKQQPKWLTDVAKLLTRVHEKNPNDYNTIVSLGNIYFDISQNPVDANKDAGSLTKSREFYQKALAINPKDSVVLTDLGLTFLLDNPPDNNKALAEFQKSLQLSPKDEKTLEGIIRANINLGNKKEAELTLEKLKQTNPKNESLAELEAKLGEK